MENHEIHRVNEIEGYTEALLDGARRRTNIVYNPEHRATTIGFANPGTGEVPIHFVGLIQLGCMAVKALLLIFHKLDAIELLLIQQELRERNKEGR